MGGVVGDGVSDGEAVIDPVRDAVKLGEAVLLGDDVRDGVMLGVMLGDGVGQGTVVASDSMAFMRRTTLLPASPVNSSPTSERATPTGLFHREEIPPVFVT